MLLLALGHHDLFSELAGSARRLPCCAGRWAVVDSQKVSQVSSTGVWFEKLKV
jgi:hypothetical protein